MTGCGSRVWGLRVLEGDGMKPGEGCRGAGVPGCRGAGLGFGACVFWKGMAWKAFQVRGAGVPGCGSRV